MANRQPKTVSLQLANNRNVQAADRQKKQNKLGTKKKWTSPFFASVSPCLLDTAPDTKAISPQELLGKFWCVYTRTPPIVRQGEGKGREVWASAEPWNQFAAQICTPNKEGLRGDLNREQIFTRCQSTSLTWLHGLSTRCVSVLVGAAELHPRYNVCIMPTHLAWLKSLAERLISRWAPSASQ